MTYSQPRITHHDLMLATPGKLSSASGWVYELKYDGFRVLVAKCGGVVRLESRNGLDEADRFPELVDELRPIPQDFVADGELVVLDERGCPQWDRLQRRHVIGQAPRIRAAAEDPACIFAFDLLWLDGADFRKRPLLDRKAALFNLLPANRRVRYTRHINGSSSEVWQLALDMELEGIVAKDAQAPCGRSVESVAKGQNGRRCGAGGAAPAALALRLALRRRNQRNPCFYFVGKIRRPEKRQHRSAPLEVRHERPFGIKAIRDRVSLAGCQRIKDAFTFARQAAPFKAPPPPGQCRLLFDVAAGKEIPSVHRLVLRKERNPIREATFERTRSACFFAPQGGVDLAASSQEKVRMVLLSSFDLRQLRLLVTAVSAQKLFWIQQQALATAANDAELSNIASRFVRDHEAILDELNKQLGGVISTDEITVQVAPKKGNVTGLRGG